MALKLEELLKLFRSTLPYVWSCVECGPFVASDEDGCCVACGGDCEELPFDLALEVYEADLLAPEDFLDVPAHQPLWVPDGEVPSIGASGGAGQEVLRGDEEALPGVT